MEFRITADAIKEAEANTHRDDATRIDKLSTYLIETDGGAFARILSATFDGRDGTLTGFARYEKTGLLVRFVTTGRTVRKGWAVRCRIYSAADTGDLAGTLVFGLKTDDDGNPTDEPDPGIGGFYNYRIGLLARKEN